MTPPVLDHSAIGARAVSVLAREGPATPSADLAARAANAALAAPRAPSLTDALSFLDGLFELARPAAGVACALALVLGVAAAARTTSSTTVAAVSSSDVAQLGIADPDASLFTFGASGEDG